MPKNGFTQHISKQHLAINEMLNKFKNIHREAKYFASMKKGSTFAPRFDEKIT